MKKRRRKIKPIALLLALVMLITSVDLSFREPEKAEAAGVCECRDGYQVHKIPASKTIAQWAHGNSLLKEFEHSSPQHAHVFERGNKKYLGWVEPATTRRSEIYYSTDGYCIRSAKYPLEVNGQKNPARINDSSFDTCMWSGGDYNQVCVYGDSPGARRLDFMYVDYERAIDICRKLDLKIYEKNGVNGYHVYFCGFITVHNNVNGR